MKYKRMPIEIEAPEGIGYSTIDYNLSESSFSDQVLGDIMPNLAGLVLCYGDHLGKAELRELIAAEAGVLPDQVLITPGAAAALFIVASSLLEKGDAIIVAAPNYATNIETPYLVQAAVTQLKLDFDQKFDLDLQLLSSLVTRGKCLVSLTYPHNPTGVTISEAVLMELVRITKEQDCALLMDETYREMTFGAALPVAASLGDHIITVASMSKAYGLPGIRIGWIICTNTRLMETFMAAKEQIFITNSVIDEAVALHYLRHKEAYFPAVKEKIRENFLILKQFMQSQNMLEWVEPGGGCICFVRVKKHLHLDMDQFYQRLLHHYKTYVGRGKWFNEDDRYMRIGYSWEPTAKLATGLHNIIAALNDCLRL